jgi:2-keto-4-pentenoate hydratase/2-oxohepta-3-ene-1,7-dioic acid hydratase in catechol pathway
LHFSFKSIYYLDSIYSNKEPTIKLPIFGKNNFYELNPSKIICLGLNYRDHIEESVSVNVKGFDKEVPVEPLLFPKTPNVLIGDGESIVMPGILKDYRFEAERTDYEAELAFIVKKRCKYVKAEDAADYILGYTCMNDVSQRNIQTSDKTGWFRGKSFDTFGPIGPVIVLADDIGDPQSLDLCCRLNGKIVQKSNTRLMIFKIPQILEYISKNFTLSPGDIISTGTPSGVGPLAPGDTVEVEIEKIGILQNTVIKE